MAPWTEKLTQESARQVRRWAVSAIECSANTRSAYLRNWGSTMPWFFPPSLPYGCETWTLYRWHIKKMELFSMRVLRSILGIRWQDHITNLEILNQAKSTSIEATIIKAQLRWVGHVIRMEECRMSRRLMYGELQVGKKTQGQPKLQYKDTVKANLQWCHIKPRDLEGYAMDRPKWRGLVYKAAANFEEARCQKLTAAIDRHRRAASAVITTADF